MGDWERFDVVARRLDALDDALVRLARIERRLRAAIGSARDSQRLDALTRRLCMVAAARHQCRTEYRTLHSELHSFGASIHALA